MRKFLLGLLVGLIVGGIAVFFLFVGVPRASRSPGAPIQPPDANTVAGTAQIVLKQDFFNEVLNTIFKDMNAPAFPVALAQNTESENPFQHAAFQSEQPCDGKITILPEGSGVKTGVQFDNNRISAPLAFAGSFDSAFGCLRFTGWAQTVLELRFDKEKQAVFGRINVETVNLDGTNPLLSGFMTPLVQTTLNNRVNPILILQGQQIALNLPIASAGGNLQAGVKD